MKLITVLHHADADGFGAAYALWTLYGDAATYIPVQYGQPVPEIPEETTMLYIVDFSYDRETCEALAAKYDLTIIDHHKTAEKALEGLPYAHFDTTKSGAALTWMHVYPGDTGLPALISYIQDRDLWRWKLPYSEEVNLYIASLPWDFEVWGNFNLEIAMAAGEAIKAFRDQQIQSAMRNVCMMYLQVEEDLGYEVPCLNLSDNISEVGNELCRAYPDAPFSASYCDRKGDVRSWSLRSIGEFDVSAVAKAFGGGCHRNAAGFTTPTGWPTTHSDNFVKAFEKCVGGEA